MNEAAGPPSDYPPPGMEIRIIQRFVQFEGGRVLEVGCGDGRLTRQYASLAASVVAFEPDGSRVAVARRLAGSEDVSNVSFLVGTAERLRPRGGPFDITLFSWSL